MNFDFRQEKMVSCYIEIKQCKLRRNEAVYVVYCFIQESVIEEIINK